MTIHSVTGGKLRSAAFAITGIVGLLSGIGQAVAAPITLNSFAQGWVNSIGTGNGGVDGNNTFTGNEFSNRFNSWAAFNIPGGVYGTATLNGNPTSFGSPGVDTIDIHDVTTLFASLQANTSGIAGYTDLGNGSLYGSVAMFNSPVSLLLSAQALADINAAGGGIFILGFTNATLNAIAAGAGEDDGIYTNGGSNGSPQLVLDTATIPEPITISLFGAGLACVAASRRRRKTEKSA